MDLIIINWLFLSECSSGPARYAQHHRAKTLFGGAVGRNALLQLGPATRAVRCAATDLYLAVTSFRGHDQKPGDRVHICVLANACKR